MTQEKFKEIIRYIGECIFGSEFENHVFAVGGCVRDSYMTSTFALTCQTVGLSLLSFFMTRKSLPVLLWFIPHTELQCSSSRDSTRMKLSVSRPVVSSITTRIAVTLRLALQPSRRTASVVTLP